MLIKVLGAICIIAACGSVGFQLSATHKKIERNMRMLISGIAYIQRELEYRMSPLPEILLQAEKQCDGVVGSFFRLLSQELEKQSSANISYCVDLVIGQLRDVPEAVKKGMLLLGKSLGQFDLDGQMKALESVQNECDEILTALTANRDVRLRNYQTIALCAGVAIAIIFI